MDILTQFKELDDLIFTRTEPPVSTILRSKLSLMREQIEAYQASSDKQDHTLATQAEKIEQLSKRNAELEGNPFRSYSGYRFKIGPNGKSDGLIYCPICPTPFSSGEPQRHLTCCKCGFIARDTGYDYPGLIEEAEKKIGPDA